MTKISTARETLARLDARIAATTDARHKSWLTTYRDHWWNEVIGDVDGVMETMSQGPIHYSFDGHSFMSADMSGVTSFAKTRDMYQGVVDLGVKMAGPADDERIFFDEKGITVYCTLTVVYPGVFLAHSGEPVDPKGFYLLRWPNVTIIQFDDNNKMMGEEIFNGGPVLVRQVERSLGDCLIDGPISLPA